MMRRFGRFGKPIKGITMIGFIFERRARGEVALMRYHKDIGFFLVWNEAARWDNTRSPYSILGKKGRII